MRHVGKVGLVAKQMVTDLHSGQLPLGEDPICHSHQELTTLVKHGGALGVRPSGGIQRLMPQVGRLAKLPVYFGSVDDASPHGRIQLGGVVCDVIHHGQALVLVKIIETSWLWRSPTAIALLYRLTNGWLRRMLTRSSSLNAVPWTIFQGALNQQVARLYVSESGFFNPFREYLIHV